jgi:predicted RNase H-like HicB family nuclease
VKYLVVIEKGESSWGAHVPDLPGCVAVGETRSEVLDLIQTGIDLHIDDLRSQHMPIPAPVSEGTVVETRVA